MKNKLKFINIINIKMDNHPLNPATLNLVRFIEKNGITGLPPINVRLASNGQYIIKDGRHRVTAFKLLGIKQILSKISIEMNNNQTNKLLADFIGRPGKVNDRLYWVNIPNIEWVTIKEMKFHESWDWLMPVVEKIESLGHRVEIFEGSCDVHHTLDYTNKHGDHDCIYVSTEDSKLEAVYIACVEYIKWYNKKDKDYEK